MPARKSQGLGVREGKAEGFQTDRAFVEGGHAAAAANATLLLVLPLLMLSKHRDILDPGLVGALQWRRFRGKMNPIV